MIGLTFNHNERVEIIVTVLNAAYPIAKPKDLDRAFKKRKLSTGHGLGKMH